MTLFFENLKIALQALWANKIRSFLTVLGVVIGVFAVIMIVAITSGLKDEIAGTIASLGSDVLDIVPTQLDQGGFTFASSPALAGFSVQEVREFEEKTRGLLRAQTPIYSQSSKTSYANKEVKGFLVGVTPDYFALRRRQAIAGVVFDSLDLQNKARVATLGVDAAIELFGQPQRAVGKKVKISGKEITVIGVLEKEELGFGGVDINRSVYLPATTVRELFESAIAREIFVQAFSTEEVSATKKRLEKIMLEIRLDGEFTIFTQETISDLVDQITGIISSALAGLAAISLLVGGIGIMNIMLVSVTERTKEIGIRKAVGATNNNILTQFLIEAVTLTLLGGLIGLLIVAVLSFIISRYLGFPTLITWQVVAGAISFSVLVGVIFGLFPAYRAAQKDPVQALSYE